MFPSPLDKVVPTFGAVLKVTLNVRLQLTLKRDIKRILDQVFVFLTVHCVFSSSLNALPSDFFRDRRAKCNRDFTVPTGTFMSCDIS